MVVRALRDDDREAIATWHYGDALSIYDPGEGAFELREPDHVALAWADGTLAGYGSFGPEARVPGGLYEGLNVIDIGMGLAPKLVGIGHGRAALRAVANEARRRRATSRLRATVAAINARASALVLRAGFEPCHRFERPRDGRAFVQYERSV